MIKTESKQAAGFWSAWVTSPPYFLAKHYHQFLNGKLNRYQQEPHFQLSHYLYTVLLLSTEDSSAKERYTWDPTQTTNSIMTPFLQENGFIATRRIRHFSLIPTLDWPGCLLRKQVEQAFYIMLLYFLESSEYKIEQNIQTQFSSDYSIIPELLYYSIWQNSVEQFC